MFKEQQEIVVCFLLFLLFVVPTAGRIFNNRITRVKRLFIAAALTIAAASPALAADVGVSISIGNPGFYGRIDIGD